MKRPGGLSHAEKLMQLMERQHVAKDGEPVKFRVPHPLESDDRDAGDREEPAAPGDPDAPT